MLSRSKTSELEFIPPKRGEAFVQKNAKNLICTEHAHSNPLHTTVHPSLQNFRGKTSCFHCKFVSKRFCSLAKKISVSHHTFHLFRIKRTLKRLSSITYEVKKRNNDR